MRRVLVAVVLAVAVVSPATAAQSGMATATATGTGCSSSWTHVDMPGAPHQGQLVDITLVPGGELWAVGTASTLFSERRSGSTWITHLMPEPRSNSFLDAVSGSGPSDVWAVGTYNDGYWYRFAEHWDGVAWSIVPLPNVSHHTSHSVGDVLAVGPDDVWVTSYHYEPGGPSVADLLHWNGANWSEVPLPVQLGEMSAAAALAPDDLWFVGAEATGWDVLRYNRQKWRVTHLDPAKPMNGIGDLAVFSPRQAWVVGSSFISGPGGGHTEPIAQRWNGTRWRSFTLPTSLPNASANGVTILSPTDVWAVGEGTDPAYHGLSWLWNGTSWQVIEVLPSDRSFLSAVAADDAGQLWAAGARNTQGAYAPLLVERCG